MTILDQARARCDLRALYLTEVGPVYGFLLARCGDRDLAEDLTAETFANAADRFAAGRGTEVTAAWLMTVARRRLVDHWRRAASQRNRWERFGRQTLRLLEVEPSGADSHDEDERVLAALSALPERQRGALTMRYIDEMSVSEVADSLELTYQAAESLLARARRSFGVAYGATP